MSEQRYNWSKLPSSLRYLAAPAIKYGQHQFDDRIYNFFENIMNNSDKEELIKLSSEMSKDWDHINTWLNQFSIVDHPEARLVYFTIHLLALGGDSGYL